MNRKEEIIQATLSLASEKGLSNISMSQIAEYIGIKKPSLYNHFKSKDEIIEATYQYLRNEAKSSLSIGEIDYARLIEQIKPKVFIYENVPGMLVHNGGNTWKVILSVFESLGYTVSYSVLNAKDYGIPQDRKRLFVVGFKDKSVKFSFPEKIPLQTGMSDYLEKNIDARHYLGKKGFEFVTNPKYRNRARVNSKIIQTEKANQQFNWNGDFVFEPLESIKKRKNKDAILDRAYISNWNGQRGAIRQLTHRECLRLMGFSDSFKIVVPNVPAYRQAGNSIVINVLEALFGQIFKAVNIYD